MYASSNLLARWTNSMCREEKLIGLNLTDSVPQLFFLNVFAQNEPLSNEFPGVLSVLRVQNS